MSTTRKSMNYSDIFYSFISEEDAICHDKAAFHFLMYVCSGEAELRYDGKTVPIRAGQCVFVRRDHRVGYTKQPLGEEPFKSVTLKFERKFLRGYFQKLQSPPKNARPLQSSVMLLPPSPYIDSIFVSMLPFFESEREPRREMIDRKMEEGILALLDIDPGFYPALFDFADPWKIDLLGFLEQNYMYDLSMEEIASYTGRSLSTLKRDFAKVSDLSPQKWLIQKRLQKAYELITGEGRKINDACYDVGFKNRSHFSIAFKKQYGYSPSEVKYVE